MRPWRSPFRYPTPQDRVGRPLIATTNLKRIVIAKRGQRIESKCFEEPRVEWDLNPRTGKARPMVVTCDGWTDTPILYDDGTVAWENPYRVPDYLKRLARYEMVRARRQGWY